MNAVNVDKDEVIDKYEKGQYDFAVHFSRKLAFDLETHKSKSKSFIVVKSKGSKKKIHE